MVAACYVAIIVPTPPWAFPGEGKHARRKGLGHESKNSDNEKMRVKSEAILLQNFLGPLKEEKGATAVEYALLAGLIAGVIAGTVALIGPALVPGFAAVSAAL